MLSINQPERLRFILLEHCDVTADLVASLVKLPAFDSLESSSFTLGALPLLTQLHSLTYLCIKMKNGTSDDIFTSASCLLPHLKGCPLLAKLYMLCFSFTELELKTLPQVVPSLSKFVLCSSKFTSLVALCEVPKLKVLHITDCLDFGLADLAPLSNIQFLEELNVDLPHHEHDAARALLFSNTFSRLLKFKIGGL